MLGWGGMISPLASLYSEHLLRENPILDPANPKPFFREFPTYISRVPGASELDKLLMLERCLPRAGVLELKGRREKAAISNSPPVTFAEMWQWLLKKYATEQRGTTLSDLQRLRPEGGQPGGKPTPEAWHAYSLEFLQAYAHAEAPLGEEVVDVPLTWVHVGLRKALLQCEESRKARGPHLKLRISGLDGHSVPSIMHFVAQTLGDPGKALTYPVTTLPSPGGTLFLVEVPDQSSAKALLALDGSATTDGRKLGVTPQVAKPTLEERFEWLWERLKLDEKAEKVGDVSGAMSGGRGRPRERDQHTWDGGEVREVVAKPPPGQGAISFSWQPSH